MQSANVCDYRAPDDFNFAPQLRMGELSPLPFGVRRSSDGTQESFSQHSSESPLPFGGSSTQDRLISRLPSEGSICLQCLSAFTALPDEAENTCLRKESVMLSIALLALVLALVLLHHDQ